MAKIMQPEYKVIHQYMRESYDELKNVLNININRILRDKNSSPFPVAVLIGPNSNLSVHHLTYNKLNEREFYVPIRMKI